MAEEFQAAVCGGSWWSSPITTFNSSSFMANYGGCWQNDDFMHLKTTSPDQSSAISPDSAFPDSSSSSTTNNWCQSLLADGNQTLPEILNSLPAADQNSSDFGMNQEQEHTSSFMTTSGDCTGNLVTSSYGYPSSLLQTLFEGISSQPPPPPQPLHDFQRNLNDLGAWNIKARYEDTRDMGSSVKNGISEPAYKRARLQTPSPLPTFKVRKEKLGDRVTALQQLVSPFGKTDTASVLHEAIEYIKLLHDQVNVLSNPYMKHGSTTQVQQINDKVGDKKEGAKQDLRSRGLCLVPVSSIFPVATETAPNYWTSGFRSTFK